MPTILVFGSQNATKNGASLCTNTMPPSLSLNISRLPSRFERSFFEVTLAEHP
jgi:hypothetical protein